MSGLDEAIAAELGDSRVEIADGRAALTVDPTTGTHHATSRRH